MSQSFASQKFNSIQALRGIAALFVVFSHLTFIGIGAFGVDIFFCISGFIMMYVTQKGSKHFLAKRLIRIVPLYYLITVFTFVLLLVFPSMFMATTADISYLIKSFFFIPYEISGVIQPIVRVGWTINYEMFFYVIFFISMKISHKYRGLICSVVLTLLAVLGTLLPLPSVFLQFYCHELLLEFVFGMISFYLAKRIFDAVGNKANKKTTGLVMILCFALVITCFWLMISEKNDLVIPVFSRVIHLGIPAFILFLAVFTLGCIIKIPAWLSFLGDISFSLYLLHYYPIMLISRIAEKSPSAGLKIGLSIVGILFVIGISAISYYLIEKKLSEFLRKKFLSDKKVKDSK